MSTEETLNWMCKDMTFWYIEGGNTKEILYPVTEDKQKIVQSILNENADLMIYGKNFYTLDKEIAKTINKTSYTYYLKKASAYKKKRGKSMLPYDLKDDNAIIINKLLTYYQKYKIPYTLVVVANPPYIKDSLEEALNPFSYINISLGKLLIHRDIFTSVNNNLVILITDGNNECLEEKRLKIKEIIQSQNIKRDKIKVINNQEFDFDYLQNILLPA